MSSRDYFRFFNLFIGQHLFVYLLYLWYSVVEIVIFGNYLLICTDLHLLSCVVCYPNLNVNNYITANWLSYSILIRMNYVLMYTEHVKCAAVTTTLCLDSVTSINKTSNGVCMMEARYYEGCGQMGPIRCIFLSEFHPVAGPKIACQFPEDYISKETFDAISAYIIPKPQIQKCTMTVNALGHKIVGYPNRIENTRYERNAYLFNLCFVCDSWSKTIQYEPVVKKLGEHLTFMEEETRFVSDGSSKLPTLLAHLLHDLNTYRKATVVEGDTVMHLKVLEVRKDPQIVRDHDVPVMISSVGLPRPGEPKSPPEDSKNAQTEEQPVEVGDRDEGVSAIEGEWDLTTRQIIPFINGYNHVSKIAIDTNVEKTLVKSCIQNLVYYDVVTLIPVLKFSNMYRATPSLRRLFVEQDLQTSCLNFINADADPKSDNAKAVLPDVLEILCALQQGTTLRAVSERFSITRGASIDIRKLIVFSQLHGLIKCLKRYPVYIRSTPRNGYTHTETPFNIRRLFTGRHCADEICCLCHIDLPTLDQIIEQDPNVSVIWR